MMYQVSDKKGYNECYFVANLIEGIDIRGSISLFIILFCEDYHDF